MCRFPRFGLGCHGHGGSQCELRLNMKSLKSRQLLNAMVDFGGMYDKMKQQTTIDIWYRVYDEVYSPIAQLVIQFNLLSTWPADSSAP